MLHARLAPSAHAAAAAPAVSATPAAAVAGLGSAAPGSKPLRVDRIAFRGNRALPERVLQSIAAPYLARVLTDADIEGLRSALTHRYTDHGYVVATVILDPDTPYHAGVLTFRAIEGRVAEIRVRGLDGLQRSYVIDRLRGAKDEVLNTDVLRPRLQRLSDDPLFARVTSQIEPGAQAGDAILEVEVQRARPYSLSVAVNNYRPPAISEKAFDAAGQVRNLTGWGDVVDADVSGPTDAAGGLGYGFGWQLPFGHHGSLASLSAARINTVFITEPFSELAVRSVIERAELRLTQPVFIFQRHQVNVSAAFAHERQSTFGDELFALLTESSPASTRSATLRLAPEYSYRSEQQYLNARFTLLHAYLLDYPPGPLLDSLPDRQYFVWTGQLHHLWDLAHAPFELESRATIQRTAARISELHALEIGGINSVRGFREDEFLAANVASCDFDLRWLARRDARSLSPAVTLGTFFDWATGHDVGEPPETFSSAGVTLRLKWTQVQADLAYGLPLVHPGFVSPEHGWQDHGIHVQIAMTL